MNPNRKSVAALLGLHLILAINISCNTQTGESKTDRAESFQKPSDQATQFLKTDQCILDTLRTAGIPEACLEMVIDFETVFAPMAALDDHSYKRYRWSVSCDERGNPLIHALPPEEEMGWTPWERWSLKDNKPIRTSWVLYPLKQLPERGIIKWYKIEESENLLPRFLDNASDLVTQLRLARIDVAAEWLGLDFRRTFIDSLQPEAQQIYTHYRWAVIPHILADDGPVIYALPPMGSSDVWPWESWYTDGHTPQIHHVHYTRGKDCTTGTWSEEPGAPQRPPEIFGFTWHWYDDPDMTLALSKQMIMK